MLELSPLPGAEPKREFQMVGFQIENSLIASTSKASAAQIEDRVLICYNLLGSGLCAYTASLLAMKFTQVPILHACQAGKERKLMK